MLGDIVEAVFKGILRTAGVKFKDNDVVNLDLGGGRRPIRGEYDLVMEGRVDDIKSASDHSYTKKFVDLETLQASDPFGYVAQLVGYATAAGKKVGGWWVVNKAKGHHKYVSAKHVDVDEVLDKMRDTYDYLENDEPLEHNIACQEHNGTHCFGKRSRERASDVTALIEDDEEIIIESSDLCGDVLIVLFQRV